MTGTQKKDRKNLIANRAAALKKSRNDVADATREAEALEAAGKWAEAAIAWGVVIDDAGGKQKQKAAGRQAAAKVRAGAEEQRQEDEAGEAAEVAEADDEAAQEAERKAREERADAIEETRASTPEEMAAEADAEKPEKTPKQPKAEKAPQARDARLPAAGTVLVKTGRDGSERVRCTILEDRVEYAGTTYKTLSAAGLKAMGDLGLSAKTCDGFAFWGLKGAPRPAKGIDLESLEKAGERYREMVTRGIETIDADQRTKVQALVARHIEALQRAITWG